MTYLNYLTKITNNLYITRNYESELKRCKQETGIDDILFSELIYGNRGFLLYSSYDVIETYHDRRVLKEYYDMVVRMTYDKKLKVNIIEFKKENIDECICEPEFTEE